jgi:hypothetical protein
VTDDLPEYDAPTAFRRLHELGDEILDLDPPGHTRALYSLLGSLVSLATREWYTADPIVRHVERALEFARAHSDEPVPARLQRLIDAAVAHADAECLAEREGQADVVDDTPTPVHLVKAVRCDDGLLDTYCRVAAPLEQTVDEPRDATCKACLGAAVTEALRPGPAGDAG